MRPRFRCRHSLLSTLRQWFAFARLPGSHLPDCLSDFSAALKTPALYRRPMRWFEISPCRAIPGGHPPSPAQHCSGQDLSPPLHSWRNTACRGCWPHRLRSRRCWRHPPPVPRRWQGPSPTPRLRGAWGCQTTSPAALVHLAALPPAGWPPGDLTCPAPLAPAPLQDLHRYYGPARPCASRYSASCGCCRLRVSLSPPGGSADPFRPVAVWRRQCSPVPHQRLRRAHATYTPDTIRAAHRQLPDYGRRTAPLSRGVATTPVSVPSFRLSMRQQWFTHVRLLVAHLARW